MARRRAGVGRGDDAIGYPHRAQSYQFEFVKLIVLFKLDKQFSIEQFEPTASQSAVPPPILRWFHCANRPLSNLITSTYTYIHIYIYVLFGFYTYTHTHIYIYIYMYICRAGGFTARTVRSPISSPRYWAGTPGSRMIIRIVIVIIVLIIIPLLLIMIMIILLIIMI